MSATAAALFANVVRCLTLAAVFLFAGCSIMEPQPTLTYSAEAPPVPPKNKQIILNPFIDHRADKTNVGTVRSTFGTSATEVVPANDVTQWVIDAIKTELQQN